MKLFQTLAQYNKIANADMIEILEKLDTQVLIADVGSYYHSILGILNHVIIGDYTWLKRLHQNHFGEEIIFSELEQVKLTTIVYQDLDKLTVVRKIIDESLILAVKALETADPQSRIIYHNMKGEKQDKELGNVLAHIFMHQTHHRGNISMILDQNKIENDYSNLIWRF